MGTWTDPNFVPEKPSVQHYLYEYTYPEILEVKHPVIDTAGILWAGPNRRGMNAPNPTDLWKAWQKSVQRHEPQQVKPHVMDYWQRTKGFSRPPKNGEIDLRNEEIKVQTPKFTWSPTKLQAFDTCPYQFAATHYYKTLPYQETEATIWGNRVHKMAELYLTGQLEEMDDPDAFDFVEKWCKVIEKIPGERFVEQKISVDDRFQPCDYDSGIGRMIADVYVKSGDTLYIFDWKTGKVKDDHFQLRTYALLLAIANPEIQKIVYKYIWTKTGIVTGGDLLRKELVPIAKELRERVERVKEAWDNEVWSPRPSGLCKNWCGVTECPHCGGKR